MFEDFQKQIDDSSLSDDEQQEESLIKGFEQEHRFLGMTSVQRFIVAVLLLMMTIIIGTLFLLVTSKIVPPFLG